MLVTGLERICLDLDGLDNGFLEKDLSFLAFGLNTVNINIHNPKSISIKVIVVLNLIELISSEDSLPNLLRLLLMESIVRLAGNRCSHLRRKSIAHISNKITNIENPLGIFLVVMINMELPVIGEPDVESSVIRGFHLHKVS